MASKSPVASTSSVAAEELDARQKRLRRFENDAAGSGPQTSLSMGPIALLKKQGKGKARAGGMEGLSIREQREMSGTPDPVFNAVWMCRYFSRALLKRIHQDVIDWDAQTIVGTSRQLEKPYLRLTSAPDPKTVRPLPVLKQTLEHLKKKWRAEGNYAWVCDQFKSLRQDLTVSFHA